jgi:hypothetical protein
MQAVRTGLEYETHAHHRLEALLELVIHSPSGHLLREAVDPAGSGDRNREHPDRGLPRIEVLTPCVELTEAGVAPTLPLRSVARQREGAPPQVQGSLLASLSEPATHRDGDAFCLPAIVDGCDVRHGIRMQHHIVVEEERDLSTRLQKRDVAPTHHPEPVSGVAGREGAQAERPHRAAEPLLCAIRGAVIHDQHLQRVRVKALAGDL